MDKAESGMTAGQHCQTAPAEAAKTAFPASESNRVWRFWNPQISGETDAVLATILATLRKAEPLFAGAAPLPDPSPLKREGL